MNNYALAIIIISVIGGIISNLISSNNDGLKRHINLIVGLVSAIILIVPLTTFAQNANKISEKIDNIFTTVFNREEINKSNQIIVDKSIDMVSEGIKNIVVKEFSIKKECIEIEVITEVFSENQTYIKEIKITLKNEATWYDEDKIKGYVADLVGCRVSIKKM